MAFPKLLSTSLLMQQTSDNSSAKEGFHFRQFVVKDTHCAMKVGTDGVLLGSLCPIPNAPNYSGSVPCMNKIPSSTIIPDNVSAKRSVFNVLDIGCGSGVVALMIAQRCRQANIVGIEIDSAAAKQAKENAYNSPWSDRLTIYEGDARKLSFNQLFDLIVCNPPYYKNGLSSGQAARDMARSAETLSFEDVINISVHQLKNGGHLCLILPYIYSEDFVYSAWLNNLQLEQEILVRTKINKPFTRSIITFIKGDNFSIPAKTNSIPLKKELILLDETSHPTDAYREIVKDFYLWA